MKIIVIGASGTIGTAVASALAVRHEVVRASRTGAIAVNMEDSASIAALLSRVRDIDAVVCCAASVKLAPLEAWSCEALAAALKAKLFGQVQLAREAANRLRDGGSITLTTGQIPAIAGSGAGALTNKGLEGFVQAAALEMPRGLRINAVSPGWVRETVEQYRIDGVYNATPVAVVARAYVHAVESDPQGQILIPTQAPS